MISWFISARYGLLIGGAAALAFLDASYLYPTDLGTIAAAGEKILSSNWTRAFADPVVQVGPLQAVLWGGLRIASHATGIAPELVFSLATHLGVLLATLFLFRLISEQAEGIEIRELILGLFLLAWGLTSQAYYSGHPEEIWVGLLWVVAARESRQGSSWRGGAAIALCAAIKQWGILGLPLLLISREPKKIAQNVALVLGGVACFYLPFVLSGHYATLGFTWEIESYSLVHLLGFSGEFTWWMRLVQGALTLLVGVVLAVVRPNIRGVEWLLPLQLITLRLILDPLSFAYYWLAVEVIVLIGIAATWEGATVVQRFIGLAGAFLLVVSSYFPRGWAVVSSSFVVILISVALTYAIPTRLPIVEASS